LIRYGFHNLSKAKMTIRYAIVRMITRAVVVAAPPNPRRVMK